MTEIDGAQIEPVDIITFGSPCQDLSVAGKRAGMKHAYNGDTETTRSGLFMEAVRIIKEMRRATHGKYPRFAVWENVPGAFSSNKGEDFRTVLEEIIKINDQTAPPLPTPDKGRWPYADVIMGNGWSVAYRTFDAQYWGVPQRRRRIYLVADFTGECAGEILFEREGLRGHFTESGEERKSVASDAQGSPGTADQESTYIIDNIGGQTEYGKDSPVNGTLRAGAHGAIAYSVENHPNDSRVNIDDSGKCQTLTTRMGTGGGNVPMVMEAFCKSGRAQSSEHATTWKHGIVANTLNTFDTGEARANELVVEAVPIHDQATRHTGKRGARTDGKGNGLGIGHPGDPMNTLTSGDSHAVVYCTTTGSYMQVTEDQTPTLMARDYKDPNVVCYGLDRASFNQGANAQFNFSVLTEQQPTLTAKGPGAVCHPTPQEVHDLIAENNADAPHQQDLLQAADGVCRTIAPGTNAGGSHLTKTVIYTGTRYIVRRLTPTECARLQGFPDTWGNPPQKDSLTDEEYAFWQKVRNTHAEINGRKPREYSKKQILTWYNKLHSDSSEYKMWGNGIALPNALYVMQGIADKLHKTREDEHTCKQSTPRKPSTSCGCPARS